MYFKKSIVGSLITLAFTAGASSVAIANEVTGDTTKYTFIGNVDNTKSQSVNYIVQLKGNTAIAQAQDLGELLPSNQLVANTGNNYNATTPAMKAYTRAMENKQNQVASSIGSIEVLSYFKHTFNGFSAKLSATQKEQLESHPDVIGVWEDKPQSVTTANTPKYLGLTGPGGQHTLDIKGEGIIIGVIDSGITPESLSFADDGSYSDPAELGWQGSCDTGTDEEFSCNNKLIGAKYFDQNFSSAYEIQYALGEHDSPRDAAGHGTHTASTAGGNENVEATVFGASAGTVSGIAPRARISAYKVCWNSDYVSPEGVKEKGCFPSDSLAAIDQAVLDGVDVINFSISGSKSDLLRPQSVAMLNATAAGIFVSVSAGNSGPDKETVGTPAPWVTNVGASTYDGTSLLFGNAIAVTAGDNVGDKLISFAPSFAPVAVGLTGDVVAAIPAVACDSTPLENAVELAGKVALIARGSCAFTQKFLNAQDAGAIGVIVYTYVDTTPAGMSGTPDRDVTIPGAMVSFDHGTALANSALAGTTSVSFTDEQLSLETVEVGHKVASFSSRGPNLNTYDIIKPDILAPGVRVLAANTTAPMFGSTNEAFIYLQGTSMAAPHVAGMAALFKESNSSWTPAQIKSALMTSARQNITKEDGITQADPFDFGSGHAAPVSALDPGLLFNTNINDYLAFLCGQDKDAFVSGYDTSCDQLTANGFTTDASQLNLPSIAIAELTEAETIFRTVSNATAISSSYTATVEAPAGFEVTVQTFDANGDETEATTLDVAGEGGKASFAVTFTKTETSVLDAWEFGAITWTDNAGHSVRLPLAIKATTAVKIEVPELITGDLKRGRFRFPVKMNYSGSTSIEHAGLVAPFGVAGNVDADPAKTFVPFGPGTKYHVFDIQPGTKLVRFSLTDSLVAEDGADLDLFILRCTGSKCVQIDKSATDSSNENVILINPEPSIYLAMIHGWSTGNAPATSYTMVGWIADETERSTRVISSRRAIKGRFNYTTIMTRGLPTGTTYMGAVTYFDNDGQAQGTSVLELKN